MAEKGIAGSQWSRCDRNLADAGGAMKMQFSHKTFRPSAAPARIRSRYARRCGHRFAAIDLVAATRVEPGAAGAGEGATHCALLLRARHDAAQAAIGVKHLNPEMAGDPVAARRIGRQAVAAAFALTD